MPTLVDKVKQNAAAISEAIAEEIHLVRHLFNACRYRKFRDGPHELPRLEARTLAFIARHPAATHSDLVAHFARDKGQIARLVGGLKERGLLETRTDDADRRIQRLDLTDAGRVAQGEIQRERRLVARHAVSGLGADERRLLLELLRKMRRNLENE